MRFSQHLFLSTSARFSWVEFQHCGYVRIGAFVDDYIVIDLMHNGYAHPFSVASASA